MSEQPDAQIDPQPPEEVENDDVMDSPDVSLDDVQIDDIDLEDDEEDQA